MHMIQYLDLLDATDDGPMADFDKEEQEVFLRQGDVDGACGPYCVLMALLTCGVAQRNNVTAERRAQDPEPLQNWVCRSLVKADAPEESIEYFLPWANRLANIQLQEGRATNSPQTKMPSEWIETQKSPCSPSSPSGSLAHLTVSSAKMEDLPNMPKKSKNAEVLEVEPIDEKLLDEAVERINQCYTRMGMELALTVGEYVLATFFDGKPETIGSKTGKGASFRELAKRADLRMSFSYVYKSVAVVAQLRLLPQAAKEALPFSHHALLLPVRSKKAKKDLAKKALTKGWSKRQLETEVRQVRDKEKNPDRTGRPPLPAFAKGFTRLTKAVDLAESEVVDEKVFARYEPAQARELLVQVDVAIERLGKIKADVSRALVAFEASSTEIDEKTSTS